MIFLAWCNVPCHTCPFSDTIFYIHLLSVSFISCHDVTGYIASVSECVEHVAGVVDRQKTTEASDGHSW